jgi:hypothetical protein
MTHKLAIAAAISIIIDAAAPAMAGNSTVEKILQTPSLEDIVNETVECMKHAAGKASYNQCQMEVYTKHGMAEQAAGAKRRLEEAEMHDALCQKTTDTRIGMTEYEVLDSKFGKPNDRHSTITAAHQHDQWVYDDGPRCGPGHVRTYLYFEDGILTAITN